MSSSRAPALAPAAIAPLPTSLEEKAKRDAGRAAVDDYVRSGMDVGVGSGSTIVYSIQRLAERAWSDERLAVRCVPTGFQSRQVRDRARGRRARIVARARARAHLHHSCTHRVSLLRIFAQPTNPPQLLVAAGLTVTDLDTAPDLDVAIDGADEVDPELNLIKGGGGCQTQEKIVAASARVFVVVADFRKRSPGLLRTWRKGVPVEVLPFALGPALRALRALGGAPVLRAGAPSKAGPMVTDNGAFVVDTDFGAGAGLTQPPADLHTAIKLIPGVVETGIFAGMAHAVYFGNEDGSVEKKERAK